MVCKEESKRNVACYALIDRKNRFNMTGIDVFCIYC